MGQERGFDPGESVLDRQKARFDPVELAHVRKTLGVELIGITLGTQIGGHGFGSSNGFRWRKSAGELWHGWFSSSLVIMRSSVISAFPEMAAVRVLTEPDLIGATGLQNALLQFLEQDVVGFGCAVGKRCSCQSWLGRLPSCFVGHY